MITRRLFTATFLFLCYVTIASGGEPVQTVIDVGMIEILRGGREIFFDNILDQSMDHSDVRYIYAAANNDWNICVRCGKSKDVFHCYAVRGNDVVRSGSESFGKTDPYGFTQFPFEWIGNLALRVQYGYGSTYGYIVWDPKVGKWFNRQ